MKLSPLFAACVVLALTSAPAFAQDRVLTKAIEVRSLSFADAGKGIPVRLRGVVVFVESTSAIFVQDETSTTFFRLRNRPLPTVGDEIEIISKTRMGLYLPGLDDSEYRVLGRRPLPPGIPAHYDDLHFGRYHYQRVTVEGIVRSVAPMEGSKSLLRLAMGSRVIDARIETPPPSDRALVDSRVRVTGLAVGLINTPRRQLIQPYVRVLNWDEVEVVTPALPAEQAPKISAEELLAFRVSGLGEQRVRIGGVVSASFGGELAYLQDGEQAFAVHFGTPVSTAPGDHLMVIGFPAMDRFSASVVDAQLLSREPGVAPSPRPIASFEDLYGKTGGPLPGQYDGELVSVRAIVRDAFKNEDGTTLLLQDKQRTMQARLPDGTPVPPVGASVRLTGIWQVESVVTGSGFSSRPDLVSLRATVPADLVVEHLPPWWTVRRLAGVLAVLGGVTLLAGLWIVVLRRQVTRQTMALRHRIEAQAVLEERQRIAREFHDTLEQELAGVSLRLDALASRDADEKARNLISASRNLVARIQTETCDLIADLRDATERAGDLVAALEGVAARQSAESGADVRVAAADVRSTLPPATVHDLRMIAREAVTNALNHGRATFVTIAVESNDERLTLRIVDNGCGFDPAAATEQRRGHFGCAGMRERARKIGAEVTWRSELQRGTTVEVTLFSRGQAQPQPADGRPTAATARARNPHLAAP